MSESLGYNNLILRIKFSSVKGVRLYAKGEHCVAKAYKFTALYAGDDEANGGLEK
jgi:hypothetical protein